MFSYAYRRIKFLKRCKRDMEASLHTERPHAKATWTRVHELEIEIHGLTYPVNKKG